MAPVRHFHGLLHRRGTFGAIDYLRNEYGLLIDQQEGQGNRIGVINKQRMRMAAKAIRLSRKLMERCTEFCASDTTIRWYQKLVAEKYDGSQYRSSPDQPQITKEIVNLVLRKLRPPASSPGG